jgi:hypothetical protein
MKNKFLAACALGLMVIGFSLSANATTYQIVTTHSGQSWEDARTQAQALGAGWDLASITSQTENDLIVALLGTGTERQELWIGAERVSGTTFQWVSGENWTYSNWWAGEPNGDGVGAVVDWRGSWAWNDEGSAPQQVMGFIAENNTPVPEPGTMALLGIGMAGLALYGKRRKHNKA